VFASWWQCCADAGESFVRQQAFQTWIGGSSQSLWLESCNMLLHRTIKSSGPGFQGADLLTMAGPLGVEGWGGGGARWVGPDRQAQWMRQLPGKGACPDLVTKKLKASLGDDQQALQRARQPVVAAAPPGGAFDQHYDPGHTQRSLTQPNPVDQTCRLSHISCTKIFRAGGGGRANTGWKLQMAKELAKQAWSHHLDQPAAQAPRPPPH